ncbi:MAG: restriction endonuclease subunit M, partial [Candidatus Korarchaeota archaeon]|nr:restriction endonuclease subunit M [Candidatus Korarchaeota archaeon]
DLGVRVLRGVAMYGPDFLFLPNGYWDLRSGDSDFILSDGRELRIDRKYLVKALRRPSLYSSSIEVDVKTYLLSVPPLPLEDLPRDLVEYIRWGLEEGTAAPAVRSKGSRWYSHVWRQLKTKKPFGYLFLPDKVGDPLRKSSLAYLTGEKVTASKNFYVVITSRRRSWMLAAWYNSTFFASLLTLMGRKISRRWTRFLLADYLEMPVPRREDERVISALKELLRDTRPIEEELSVEGSRYKLDVALGRALSIPEVDRLLESLYSKLADLVME